MFYLDDKKSLRATLLDPAKGTVGSDSHVITDQVGFQPSVYWGAFSVAENGTIVYTPHVGAALSVLTWLTAPGKNWAASAMSEFSRIPTLSPDG